MPVRSGNSSGGPRGAGSRPDTLKLAVDAAAEWLAAEPGARGFLTDLERAARRGRLRLPVISQTVTRVVQLMDDPDVDLDELSRCVELDPSLATKVMGVANSSYFRGTSAVPNVREALMRMGVREARTIVVVVALRSTILRAPGLGPRTQELWRHSLLAALAAQEILLELPPWQQAGFLAGLVHDIGRIVVLGFADAQAKNGVCEEALSASMIEGASDLLHAELGSLVLHSWSFSDDFVDAVRHHHRAEECPGAPRTLARALGAADLLAHRLESGWPDGASELDDGLAPVLAPLGLDFEAAAEIAVEAAAGYETLSKLA